MISKLFGYDSLIELFSSAKFWYTILIIVGVIVLLVYAIKNWRSGGSYVIIGLFAIVVLVMTGYSIIQLNYYYSASGGIHGVISGIFNPNRVEKVDEMTFKISDTELTETENGYSASIMIDEIMELNPESNYWVYVNNVPCSNVSNSIDYIVADFKYNFYNDYNIDDSNLIVTDTLNIRFTFYGNYTSLTVSTSAESNVVKYWNYYFNNNNFVINIKQLDFRLDDSIDVIPGDTSNYCVVNYFYNSNLVDTQYYITGSELELTDYNTDLLVGWTINDVLVNDGYKVTNSINLYAKLRNQYIVKFLFKDDVVHSENVSSNSFISTDVTPSDINNITSYICFDGWSLDGVNIVDYKNCEITEDTTFVALYHIEYPCSFILGDDSLAYSTQRVEAGGYVSEIVFPSNYTHNYWTVNNTVVDNIYGYVINEHTVFVSVGYYTYNVSFKIGDSIVNSQSVIRYGKAIEPSVDYEFPSGYEFLGWSFDGKTLVNVNEIEIVEDTVFIAVLSNAEYTLTIDFNNGTSSQSITGTYGMQYELTIPTYSGYTFVEWRIKSGEGIIDGNIFTFGGSDVEIYAVYDFIELQVSFNKPVSFDLIIGDDENKLSNQSSFIDNIDTNISSMTIRVYSATASLGYETDGNCTVFKFKGSSVNGNYVIFMITWTDASYLDFDIFWSNVVYV